MSEADTVMVADAPRRRGFARRQVAERNAQPVRAEDRIKALKLELPQPPTPFGAYVEAVRTGSLLFLSGMLPVGNEKPKFFGVIGKDLSLEEGRQAARLACLNALAATRDHLGSLDRVTKVVRLGIALVAAADFKEHPKVADGASELLVDVFGKDKASTRLVLGVATLPLGLSVEIELILEFE